MTWVDTSASKGEGLKGSWVGNQLSSYNSAHGKGDVPPSVAGACYDMEFSSRNGVKSDCADGKKTSLLPSN